MQPSRKDRHLAILLVKTSSMGDVVHALPAISDIAQNLPTASIDWLVEDSFAELPRMHPAVGRVISVALRRWRGALWSADTRREFKAFREELYWRNYDIVIDAQGLVKSAVLARFARGELNGQGFGFAREPLASLFYQRRLDVPWNLPAIDANRRIAARAMDYRDPSATSPDYGIRPHALQASWLPQAAYAVLLHGASNAQKLWAEQNWQELGQFLNSAGMRCVLPWGSAAEHERALRLAAVIPGALAAPGLNLSEAAQLLAGAKFAIGVDSGLSHLAAAVGTPVIAVFNGSDPSRTGVVPMEGCFARNLGREGKPASATELLPLAKELLP